jgi:hypothetical protein
MKKTTTAKPAAKPAVKDKPVKPVPKPTKSKGTLE